MYGIATVNVGTLRDFIRLRRPSSMTSESQDGINCDKDAFLDEVLGDRACREGLELARAWAQRQAACDRRCASRLYSCLARCL